MKTKINIASSSVNYKTLLIVLAKCKVMFNLSAKIAK